MVDSTKQVFKAGAYVATSGTLAKALLEVWFIELWNLDTVEKVLSGAVLLVFAINVTGFAVEKIIKLVNKYLSEKRQRTGK